MRSTAVASDWGERWRSFHKGVVVGPLWIGPPWEQPPDETHAVLIDPGRAFGTGAHPTTRLCVELLARVPCGSLLDAGCGSGVLAIAAAKTGFAPVLALDNDPAAVQSTRANAQANAVMLDVRLGDALVDELPEVDVAVANVTLAAVRVLGPRISARRLITSGYLADDDLELAGFRRSERLTDRGWAADLHEK